MDFNAYRQQFFAQPPPPPRFAFVGLHGLTLYFALFSEAVAYYQEVLGSPEYQEGDNTRGWRIGNTWLTLLQGSSGSPQNVEVMIAMQAPEQVERLHAAFAAAGGVVVTPPSKQIMYEPVHYSLVRDPFGTAILIFCPLPDRELAR
ncbi:MAG: hypothetical protein HC822_20820 [Oscillochloris sp.]|nr:hypothetical protein [Oscillochloris sp.]